MTVSPRPAGRSVKPSFSSLQCRSPAFLIRAASICLALFIAFRMVDQRQLATLRSDVEILRAEMGRLGNRLDGWEQKQGMGSQPDRNAGPRSAAAAAGHPAKPDAPPPAAPTAANVTLDGPPSPFDASSTPQSWLSQYALPQEITIHGVTLKYAVRRSSHVGFIRDHVKRESDGYALLRDSIARARERRPGEVPLVLDVGSNHGLYALFAAKLGADVVALEPQSELCRVISEAARLNGEDVAGRIAVYQNAALDVPEVVSMQRTALGEGGVGTVARQSASGVSVGESVAARPVADFVPPSEKREVCFLKVDVEGFELRAIASVGKDLLARVRNVLVEFGPPSRWRVAKNTAEDGEDLVRRMEDEEGFEPRLVNSFVWAKFLGMAKTGEETKRKKAEEWQRQRFAPVVGPDQRRDLIQAMGMCNCEGYLWFTRDKEAGLETSAASNEAELGKMGNKGDSIGGGDNKL